MIGSGMGMPQLMQFFSGAFAVSLTAKSMSWQKGISPAVAYSHIYWGMSLLIIIAFALLYLLRIKQSKW
jgi:DHA2 family metal-tetracycline-proton antiporter-like MFS transporter